jgi:O-antigen ligase
VTTVASLARRRTLVIELVAIPVSLLAAEAIGSNNRMALLPVLAVCGVGLLLLVFNVPPERTFLLWFLAAPFLQASSRASSVGHGLSQLLYEFPPLLFVLWAATTRSRPIRATFVDVLPAAFLVLALVSLLDTRVGGTPTVRGVLTTVGFAAVGYYFCAFGPVSPRFREAICGLLLGTALILAVMALVEAAVGWNLWHNTDWQQVATPRVVATLDNPAVLGTYLAIAVAVALIVVFWGGPARLRKPALAVILVSPPALFFTYTRGPIVGLLAAAFPILLLRRSIRAKSAITLCIAGLVLAFAWGSFANSQVYQKRVSNSATVQTRVIIQNWSFKLAREKPVLGWGYGSFDRIKNSATNLGGTADQTKLGQGSTSHDTFLTILVELGGVGLALFLLPWLIIGRRLLVFVRSPGPERWFGLVCLATCAVFFISAATFDMRFFSFVSVLPWIALGCGRRLTAHPR